MTLRLQTSTKTAAPIMQGLRVWRALHRWDPVAQEFAEDMPYVAACKCFFVH